MKLEEKHKINEDLKEEKVKHIIRFITKVNIH